MKCSVNFWVYSEKKNNKHTPSDRMSPSTPCLLATYAGELYIESIPRTEEVFKITPPLPPDKVLMWSIASYVEWIIPI